MRRLSLLGAVLVGGLDPGRLVAAGTPIVTTNSPAAAIAAGDSAMVALEVTIAPGYHVQANPASHEFLVPLEVSVVDTTGAFVVGDVRYPEPIVHRLEGTDEDLATYEGVTVVGVPITVRPETTQARQEIRGEVRYQACTNSRCLMPSAISFSIQLTVVAPDSTVAERAPPLTP